MINQYHRFQDWLTGKLPVFTLFFCVIQPLLDILGYWQDQWGVGNAVTLLARMLLLGCTALFGFVLSDRKWIYWTMAGILTALTGAHIFACIQAGPYVAPITDVVNLVRIYLMPVTTLCFMTFLKKNDKVFPALKKGLVLCLAIIVSVQIISTLTGTDPHTYPKTKTGILGWFLWTNSQSAILSMLAPIAIAWTAEKWPGKVLPLAAVTLLGEASLYFLAPRLAYAGMVAGGLGMAASLFIMYRRQTRQALVVLLCTLVFLLTYKLSPTYHRQITVYNQTVQDQQFIDEAIETEPTLSEEEVEKLSEEEREALRLEAEKTYWEAMRKIYISYLYGPVQHFGLERVVEYYNHSVDFRVVGNNRSEKIAFCSLLMEDSPVSSHLFGLNLSEMKEPMVVLDPKTETWVNGYEIYDVENDFHGIYFLCGWVGLALMIAFLLYFGLRALKAMLTEYPTYFTGEFAAFGIAYCCALAHAYFTASILRRNNASVYLAMVLAAMWYLSRRELSAKNRESSQPAQS